MSCRHLDNPNWLGTPEVVLVGRHVAPCVVSPSERRRHHRTIPTLTGPLRAHPDTAPIPGPRPKSAAALLPGLTLSLARVRARDLGPYLAARLRCTA
jgi:hypothetical protein